MFLLVHQRRALKPCDFSLWQAKACEALEALDELLESEVPIITSHLSEVLTFCLEVSPGLVLSLLIVLMRVSLSVSDSSWSLGRWLKMWPWVTQYVCVFSAASHSWSK